MTSIFVFVTIILSAQLNPRHIYVNEKIDVANQVEIQSLTFPPTVTNNGFPDSGRDTLSITPVSGVANTYTVNFDPPSDFIGDTEIIIEYFESGAIPGIPYPNYTTIHYRIKPSKVETNHDFVLDPNNNVSVFPLDNDNSTDGSLSIQKIGFVSGGTASIAADDQIDFTFDTDAETAQVMYFAEDDLGTVESSLISLQKEDASRVESRSVYLDNKSPELIELSSNLFEIDTDVAHGTLSVGSEGHIWIYTPDEDYDGSDYARLTTSSGGDVEIFFTVLDKTVEHSFVIDDEVHTVIDGAVSFNVFDNDLRSDFQIVDYSSDLSYNGDGSFSYSPPTGFSGDQIFYYKVFSGIEFHTGNINVHVDNYAPSTELNYSFDIINDHPLKITHHSPVEAYTFSVLVTPSNGTVEILDANGSSIQECDTIIGVNTIVYTPDTDYNGNDEFDLEYCTASGSCEVVKIDVHVLDSNYDECLCINNCVYEGDNNDDGIVNAKDILDIGLNIGNGGLERTNDFNLLWTGQESDDWGHEQMNSNIDLKCGDSDGDGYIDAADFTAVSDNYGKLHRLISSPVTTLSNAPITFDPQQTEVDSGEWLTIDISIGSFAYPALDFHGAAFNFTIDPDLIDSSSVIFTLYDKSWLNDDLAPVTSFYTVPEDGTVELAVSRITGSADGLGIIGKLEFIVEDEIQGLKDIEYLLSQINIGMTNIISVNAHGEYVRHPDVHKAVKLNRDGSHHDIDISDYISVYPNPAIDRLTIDSEKYSIERVEIYDALGRLQKADNLLPAATATVDLHDLHEGIYFVRVYSNGDFVTRKINKLRF